MIQEIVDGILDAAIVEEEVAEEDVGFNDLINSKIVFSLLESIFHRYYKKYV